MGVPLAAKKKEGPTPVIVFLGIIIDTEKQQLRLPEDKLTRLQDTVAKWLGKKSCTRCDLESLVGSLMHACRVIKVGRSFLRRAISLLSGTNQRCRHHHICLNASFRSDITWWKVFASHWNGASLVIGAEHM